MINIVPQVRWGRFLFFSSDVHRALDTDMIQFRFKIHQNILWIVYGKNFVLANFRDYITHWPHNQFRATNDECVMRIQRVACTRLSKSNTFVHVSSVFRSTIVLGTGTGTAKIEIEAQLRLINMRSTTVDTVFRCIRFKRMFQSCANMRSNFRLYSARSLSHATHNEQQQQLCLIYR